MNSSRAHAKINLALVVGPLRADGKHDVVTVMHRVELCDVVTIEPGAELAVVGFGGDTLVRDALLRLSERAGVEPSWRVHIDKHIPVAAGLGGGSSDAAAALELANETLASPLAAQELHELAAGLGADVPFFLREGPQLGRGDGSDLESIGASLDVSVLLVLPEGEEKASTAEVYRRFDLRDGATGFEERRQALLEMIDNGLRVDDLPHLPRNDLTSSALAGRLEQLGAYRADVSGAGPVVYGLFSDSEAAKKAALSVAALGRIWLTKLCW